MIALIGGIGPAAGLNLARIITEEVKVERDQDHLPWMLMNQPSRIPDRTDFLLGKVKENPGDEIARQIITCERAGCTVAGIACNTAHAPEIIGRIREVLEKENSRIMLVHAIDEMVKYVVDNLPEQAKIGILSTTGSYLKRLHAGPLEMKGFEIIDIGLENQEKLIHEAIYNPEWGIKHCADPVGEEALQRLQTAIDYYREKSAGAIVLACSEISLVIDHLDYSGLKLIKPMTVLARALIRTETSSA